MPRLSALVSIEIDIDVSPQFALGSQEFYLPNLWQEIGVEVFVGTSSDFTVDSGLTFANGVLNNSVTAVISKFTSNLTNEHNLQRPKMQANA